MKIGFSFGRCIRDIAAGLIDIGDVLVIVTGTRIEKREHLAPVIQDYMFRPGYLMGMDENTCVDIAHQLWDTGKLHQPRNFAAAPLHAQGDQIWADVLPSIVSENETIQEAWSAYRMLLNLVHNVPDPLHLKRYDF